MTSEIILQLLARLLPSIMVLILAFVAAGDRGTRERWTNLLYQAGSIRGDQRDDPKIQRGVRLPFFLVAFLLLYWPFNYYRHATRTIEVKSDLYTRPAQPATPAGTPGTIGTPGVPGAVVPGAPVGTPTPSRPTNLYGTPMP